MRNERYCWIMVPKDYINHSSLSECEVIDRRAGYSFPIATTPDPDIAEKIVKSLNEAEKRTG